MTGEGRPVASVYREDPRLQPLIGPGGPFEVEDVIVNGTALRDFSRAPRTVIDVFHMGAAHEGLVHLVHEGQRTTFAEVRGQARSLARALRTTFGVRQGDRVAIGMRNLPEFVVSFWGAALAGAIVVPLNSLWTGGELTYALEHAGASAAVMDGERLDRVLGHGRPDGVALIGARTPKGDVPFDELVAGPELGDDEFAVLDRDDPVTILYTSGTTGRPRGALGTNRGHVANLWNMAFVAARESLLAERAPASTSQSGTVIAAPMFHIGGIAAIIGGQLGGSKIVLMRKWNVEEALRLAVEERVTGLGGVPAMAQQILEHPGVAQMGIDVRTFAMGGAPVPPDLPTRALELFGDGVQLFNGYGLTETTSAVVANVGLEFATRPDSVGRPNLTADIRIVDAEGRDLDVGETGEVCVRSPQVARGYWNDDAGTRESFRDGWFHSGDVGYIDDEGFVYIVDRIKDVVIRGGENVHCIEVEAILHDHPAVAMVAIIGLVERAMGERVCAVVVPRPGATVTLHDLRAFAADRLAAFKIPEALAIVDVLPMTATEKVAKNLLRDLVAEASVERLW